MAAEAEAAREARAKAIQVFFCKSHNWEKKVHIEAKTFQASGEAQAAQNLQQAGQVQEHLFLFYFLKITLNHNSNSSVKFWGLQMNFRLKETLITKIDKSRPGFRQSCNLD